MLFTCSGCLGSLESDAEAGLACRRHGRGRGIGVRDLLAAPRAVARQRPVAGRGRRCRGGRRRRGRVGDTAGGLPALSRMACGPEGRLRHRARADRPVLDTAAPAEPVRPDADLLGGRRRALHPPVVQRQLAVLDRPVLGEGLRAGHLRPHPGVPDGALGPAVEDPAGRRCRHRAAAGRGDPAPAAAGRRGRLDLQLPVAVPAQRARLHVGPGAGARPVRGVQLRRPRARPRGRGGGDPSLRHRHAAAEAGAGHRHARRPAVPAVRDPLSAADDRRRRRQRAVRHRHLGVRGRPRGRLVRLPVRVDRRRSCSPRARWSGWSSSRCTTPRSRSSR